MSASRIPQFPESIIIRGQANARNDLNVYSKAEVDSAIAGVDLSALESQIASISGDVMLLETTVQDISGNLSIDISNLDVSLTQKITEDCMQSEGISGAGTTLNGHLIITINGVTYKLATVL